MKTVDATNTTRRCDRRQKGERRVKASTFLADLGTVYDGGADVAVGPVRWHADGPRREVRVAVFALWPRVRSTTPCNAITLSVGRARVQTNPRTVTVSITRGSEWRASEYRASTASRPGVRVRSATDCTTSGRWTT